MNLEGKILGNRYEIIEKIGTGGMATVYRAKDLVLKRDVAVKILRDEFTTDNEFIKRFNIEAQAAASITHSNIVSVYDVGNENNLYYIVMELVKGKTLKEIVVEEGALPWKWAVKVAIQIAAALEKAHANNIIHRDIKPHNIVITEEGVAKVTDFGIAKAVSNSTITAFGTTLGSVHYFSPEHAKGGYTDAKSDLYSLGVVLYEMVTGRVPFDADTPVSVALKHMQEEPVEPIVLNSKLPMSVNKIIMKAMKKDPEQRYQTATEMKKDLEMALKDTQGEFVDKTIFIEQEDYIRGGDKKPNHKKQGKFAKIKTFFAEHTIIKWLTIFFCLALAFILSMVITFAVLKAGRPKNVQIPNFVGKTLEEIKQEAENLKIKVEVEEEKYDVEIPEGQIIKQEPKYQKNYSIKENSTIKVIVSLGQEIVTVPKVVGEKKDDAIKILRSFGLEYEFLEEYNDEIEKGYITKQDIAEGEEILAGSKITMTVSTGIEQVEVPSLEGKTEEEAKAAITQAKLKWKSTSKVSDSSKPNGKVVNQSLSAKSMVDKDTEITITVNEFSEMKTGTITVNVKSLLNGAIEYEDEEKTKIKDVKLKITVGADTIYNETVSPTATSISASNTNIGTQTVKVYINEVVKGTRSFNFNTQTSITIE